MITMSKKKPFDASTYPLRVCSTMHECRLCGKTIKLGQPYFDGGYGRRCHQTCWDKGRKERESREEE